MGGVSLVFPPSPCQRLPTVTNAPQRSWTVSGPPIIIPGPPPVTIRPEDSFSLNLKCNDCRTSGEIIASMSNEDDGPLSMGLTFYNVGAHIDLGLVATNKLTVTFTLGAFLSTQNMTVITSSFPRS